MRPLFLRELFSFCLFAVLASVLSGCGFLGAITNPKVAWAIRDPAPMAIVVRRADAALATTVEVDRLLGSTPASADSDWLTKVAPSSQEAAADMKALSLDPMYKKSHARVVASEVWMRTLPAVRGSGKSPNLLAAIDPKVGEAYAAVVANAAAIESLSALADQEDTLAAAKDATPDSKKAHEDTKAKLLKQKSDAEAALVPLRTAFVSSLRAAAAKVPEGQRKKLSVAVANLLQALDDAEIANSAAAVRYPLAIQSLPQSVEEVVPILVADILEERMGRRPKLDNLKPQVSLNGTDVSVTLAGLSPSDLGALSMTDLTKEVVVRSGKWVVHAVTLLGTVSSTKDRLVFQESVLNELLGGLGGSATTATLIPAPDSPEVTAATAATLPSPKAHKREAQGAPTAAAKVKKKEAATKSSRH